MKNIYLLILLLIIVLGAGFYYFTKNMKNVNNEMSFFITSVNPGRGGDFGGLAGADAYCQNLAEKAGIHNKTWAAYLSASDIDPSKNINAKDRIGGGPWYNFNGTLIAKSLEELHSKNNLKKETALNEKGEQIKGRGDQPNDHDILTGSDNFGMAVSTTTDTTCQNWTAATGSSAIVGHHDRIGRDESEPMKSWVSSHQTRGCSLEQLRTTGGAGLIYCFAK